MKLRLIATGFVIGAVAVAATQVSSQQAEPDADEQARMMELWEKMASPGEQHEILAQRAGEWEVHTKIWMAGPDAPPQVTRGSASRRMVMGGRFLQTEYKGEMMGQPFEGFSLAGYDNYKRKYTSVWVDSASTAMSVSEGMLNQTGDTITFWGTMDEWMTDEHDKPVKYVDRMVDANTNVFEIHDLSIIPGETRVIEVRYTRAKQ